MSGEKRFWKAFMVAPLPTITESVLPEMLSGISSGMRSVTLSPPGVLKTEVISIWSPGLTSDLLDQACSSVAIRRSLSATMERRTS